MRVRQWSSVTPEAIKWKADDKLCMNGSRWQDLNSLVYLNDIFYTMTQKYPAPQEKKTTTKTDQAHSSINGKYMAQGKMLKATMAKQSAKSRTWAIL